MNKQRQDSTHLEPVKVGGPQQSKRPRTSTACVRCHLKKVIMLDSMEESPVI